MDSIPEHRRWETSRTARNQASPSYHLITEGSERYCSSTETSFMSVLIISAINSGFSDIHLASHQKWSAPARNRSVRCEIGWKMPSDQPQLGTHWQNLNPQFNCSQDIRESIYTANVRDSWLFSNKPYFASLAPVLLHEIKMDILLVSKQMTSEFRMAYSGLIQTSEKDK